MKKIIEKIRKFCRVSMWKFIKYNYLTKGVIRNTGAYIIPYKHAVLEIERGGEWHIEKTLHFGINRLRGSAAEARVRIRKGGKWISHGDVLLFVESFVDVHENALFETGFFSINAGSIVVVAKHIQFGEDVMIGREVTIYDSDFHQVRDENDRPVNFSQDVIIGDKVWLTNKIAVLKGVRIGEGSLISAMTLIRKDVPAHSLVAGNPAKVLKSDIRWSRESICEYEQGKQVRRFD
ncbi:acyltransferase [Candidatus Acetatifactor stercoripullorum]|uniref:acyltransferase n=1 Tax=Candidatus Acetatifactor stercoripullorum TaxID=2838414 RepID=UPI00298D93F3|nr:acyltransferase [Candidatus Acetatifactor stercoripullorum]